MEPQEILPGSYERDFTPSDRLSLMFRHEQARFDIPNEQVQQVSGQRQDGAIFENMGIASYQHLFFERCGYPWRNGSRQF